MTRLTLIRAALATVNPAVIQRAVSFNVVLFVNRDVVDVLLPGGLTGGR